MREIITEIVVFVPTIFRTIAAFTDRYASKNLAKRPCSRNPEILYNSIRATEGAGFLTVLPETNQPTGVNCEL
jgi:hypothetical protein